jgi:hypothetical protein
MGTLVLHSFLTKYPMKPLVSPFSYLSLALGILASCSRDSDLPQPEAEATYSRTVVYLDAASPSRLDSTFKSPTLKPFARQNATVFTVFLQPLPNREAVSFNLLRANLPASRVGTYTLKTKQDATRDTDFEYRIEKPDTKGYSNWLYSRLVHSPTGSFTITAYDATHHLVSGNFTVDLANVSDPFALNSEFSPRRCNLKLQGSFTNAPVEDIE